MSSTNLGEQSVLFDFKHPAKGGEFNKLFRGILSEGIYSGANVSVFGGWGTSATIRINPFTVGVNEGDERFIVIKTISEVELTIPPALPYIYCTYEWKDIIENWLDFDMVATPAEIPENAIVFGRAIFTGSEITSWDYSLSSQNFFSTNGWKLKGNAETNALQIFKDDVLHTEFFNDGGANIGGVVEINADGSVNIPNVANFGNTGIVTVEDRLLADIINEKTLDAGVSIENILFKDGFVNVEGANTLGLYQPTAGVGATHRIFREGLAGEAIFGLDSAGNVVLWNTVDSPLYLGTYEEQPIKFRVNGNDRMELTSNGTLYLPLGDFRIGDQLYFDRDAFTLRITSSGIGDVSVIPTNYTAELTYKTIGLINPTQPNNGIAPDGYANKRLFINDGGGNFGLRQNCYYDGGDRYGADGCGATLLSTGGDNNSGSFVLKMASNLAGASLAGDLLTWDTIWSFAYDGSMTAISDTYGTLLQLYAPTGNLRVYADPIDNNDLCRKSYVDSLIAASSNPFPVGAFYVQYPNANSNTDATEFPVAYRPATLFGGTWAEQWSTENVFFRTRGTLANTDRVNGLQPDEVVNHRHAYPGKYEFNSVDSPDAIEWINDGPGTYAGPYSLLSGNAFFMPYRLYWYSQMPQYITPYGGNPNTASGSETRVENRRIKVWKRTA